MIESSDLWRTGMPLPNRTGHLPALDFVTPHSRHCRDENCEQKVTGRRISTL
jgi:hypothetical protein